MPDDFLVALPEELSARSRYELLTSLVVPRPIGWISTRSGDGIPNLAPFSYFAALTSSPLMVGVSIGARRGEPKDTLRNIHETGVFCVNVCNEDLLEPMNLSSGEYPDAVNEFEVAGLTPREGESVASPWVAEAPAAMECELVERLDLRPAPNTLVIGRVVRVHLSRALDLLPGTWSIDPRSLRPVGRLGKDQYLMPREIRELPRPP